MNKERVLIIEDEMDLLDLIDFNLTRRGFVTASALDGVEGMGKIDSFNPDIIILDLMLPGMDGWEICAELKKRKKEIPVIMVTAKCMPEDKVRGLEAGAADYIAKPFNIKELVIRIDKLLEKKRYREIQDILFHEVTNRMTTIGCYSGLLSRTNPALSDENAANYLRSINHQVAYAFESISELKTLINVESGEMSLKKERCDVLKILRQTAESYKGMAEFRSVRLTVSGVEIAPAVNADSSALKQVFINIIGNAVKYSKENGNIEVTMQLDNGGLSVSVKDDGPGIPAADLPNIFRNGYRARNVKGVPGSGIGLHVVKKLLDMMDAKIDVKSVEGSGSEFTIAFNGGRGMAHENPACNGSITALS